MVTALMLNPCIDRTLFLDGLRVGGRNVAAETQELVAGKAVNVCAVLQALDVPCRCVGFDFPESGLPVAAALQARETPFTGVPAPGRLRVNTKVLDRLSGEMTELNEAGARLPGAAAEEILAALSAALADSRILVLSGSVPPGLPDDVYARAIRLAKAAGVFTVLDASGPAFRLGLAEGPDLIKPNREEAAQLLGRPLGTVREAAEACGALRELGAGSVCLTLGGEGALYAAAGGCWRCESLPLPVRGLSGAGDSTVAGLCAALLAGEKGAEVLRSGMAAAHASIIRPGTLLCRRPDYDRLRPLLRVEQEGGDPDAG